MTGKKKLGIALAVCIAVTAIVIAVLGASGVGASSFKDVNAASGDTPVITVTTGTAQIADDLTIDKDGNLVGKDGTIIVPADRLFKAEITSDGEGQVTISSPTTAITGDTPVITGAWEAGVGTVVNSSDGLIPAGQLTAISVPTTK
jgi:hypothetical protein